MSGHWFRLEPSRACATAATAPRCRSVPASAWAFPGRWLPSCTSRTSTPRLLCHQRTSCRGSRRSTSCSEGCKLRRSFSWEAALRPVLKPCRSRTSKPCPERMCADLLQRRSPPELRPSPTLCRAIRSGKLCIRWRRNKWGWNRGYSQSCPSPKRLFARVHLLSPLALNTWSDPGPVQNEDGRPWQERRRRSRGSSWRGQSNYSSIKR